MLIFNYIKSLVVIPSKFYSQVQPIETVLYCTFVGAGAHGSVSERGKFVVIWSKYFPRLVSWSLQDDDHERTHQESRIRLLRVIKTRVVVDLVSAILLVINQFLKLFAKQMYFPQIKGAKVCEEWLINQIVINTEIECVGPRLRWILVRDPVQAARNNLNRFVITFNSPLSVIFCLD